MAKSSTLAISPLHCAPGRHLDSIRSPTPTWHDCHWYFLVFWCPRGVSCGDHLSLARNRSRQDVDAESSRSQRTCPIGTANGSPIPIPCGCARTRWHRLAEAETMGWQLAVVIIGTQVLGDVTNIFYGRIIQGVVGVTIAGPLAIVLTSCADSVDLAIDLEGHESPSGTIICEWHRQGRVPSWLGMRKISTRFLRWRGPLVPTAPLNF